MYILGTKTPKIKCSLLLPRCFLKCAISFKITYPVVMVLKMVSRVLWLLGNLLDMEYLFVLSLYPNISKRSWIPDTFSYIIKFKNRFTTVFYVQYFSVWFWICADTKSEKLQETIKNFRVFSTSQKLTI